MISLTGSLRGQEVSGSVRKTCSRHSCRCFASQAAQLGEKDPKDVRVLVVGPTGYIGRFVVKELIQRGYQVVAFAREKSGIRGKLSREQTAKVGFGNFERSGCEAPLTAAVTAWTVVQEFEGADIRFGDVSDVNSVAAVAFRDRVDVVVSCLASRTGGKVPFYLLLPTGSRQCRFNPSVSVRVS